MFVASFCIFCNVQNVQTFSARSLFVEVLGFRFGSMFGMFLDFCVSLLSRVLDGLLLDVDRFCLPKGSILVVFFRFCRFCMEKRSEMEAGKMMHFGLQFEGARGSGEACLAMQNLQSGIVSGLITPCTPCGGSANLCAAPSAA